MTTIGGISGGLTVAQVTGGLDLEAFMMQVSAQRANNLETQMANQIQEIKDRQAQIASLNDLLNSIRALARGKKDTDKVHFGPDMFERLKKAGLDVGNGKVDDKVADLQWRVQHHQSESQRFSNEIARCDADIARWKAKKLNGGIATDIVADIYIHGLENQKRGLLAAKAGHDQHAATYKAQIETAKTSSDRYTAEVGTLNGWAEQLKSKLDSLNSTSQMDMIRLQSLSNKRNEAFEQLTNFVQKFAKSRESIISNMR